MSLKKILKKLVLPILLLIFCLVELNSLTKSYWLSSHDGVFHTLRIKEYYYELTQGHFPVRWTTRLDNNYGIPLFNYVCPLPYLLSSLPLSFGLNERDAYKIVIFLSYFAGVLGFYFLNKNKNKFIAFISAMLYGLTPYLFLNIFVRGAFGEIVAMAIIPWLIYAFKSHKKILSVITLSALLLSHNFLGPIFLAFLIVYLVWTRNFNKNSLFGIIFALGLSAFFLLPMFFEKQYIVSGANNNFTFDYRQHFIYPQQLLYGKWDYWYSNPGPGDGMSFQLGFANILIIFLSALYLLIRKKGRELLFLFLATIFTLFLIVIYSQPLWQLITPLQIIQFPWRFLFLTTLLFPLMFSQIFNNSKIKNFIFKSKIIPLLLLLLAFYNTRNYRRPMEFQGPEKYQQWLDIYDHKTTTASRDEVSPKWTTKEKFTGASIHSSDKNTKINYLNKNSSDIDFNIESTSSSTPITVLKNYFPGWSLINTDSKKTIEIFPDSDGNIQAQVSSGNYQLSYRGTKLQHLSNYLSLFTLVILLISSIKIFSKKNE